MRTIVSIITTISVLAVAGVASAADEDSADEGSADEGAGYGDRPVFGEVGAGVGLGISTAGLGLSPVVFLEGGALFPLGPGALTAGLRLGFETYSTDASGTLPCSSPDPCVAADGGNYSYDINEQTFFFGLPISYRFLTPDDVVQPYVGLMPTIFLLKATSTAFDSENQQTDTQFGIALFGGAQFPLGPGGILAELGWQYASLQHSITGDSSLSAVTILAGYRFLL